MKIPSVYVEGYQNKARPYNQEIADTYIRHTTIGDEVLDPVMEELSTLPPAEIHRFIEAGINGDWKGLAAAPQCLRDFFVNLEEPPWVNFEEFGPGKEAFYANMTNMLIAYAVGSAVEGFSTLVSKSFSITGRVTGLDDGATKRLRQNNRHMVEVYFPDGLKRERDGWKVSLRISFIHCRIRQLMKKSGLWDYDAWGEPLSAAHVGGVALFTFSIRQFEHAVAMGSRISQEQKGRASSKSGATPAISSGCPKPSSSETKTRHGSYTRSPTCASRPRDEDAIKGGERGVQGHPAHVGG